MNLLNSRVMVMIMLLFSGLSADERYAFIYSKNIDDRFINFYDKVVVEADAIDNIYAIRYPKKMVAYVSVGEIEPWRKTKTPYDKSWVISENKTWNSLIADLRNDAYQEFIFERIDSLYKNGYRNFFLDTM
ncbi:endo alpha-1,4 polygalactosaminidase, partial [Sulfurovum sp. bin170]|uniref:endo alpha-1,4 polygalactosaminidase n=1 Tax=Sulfurovum sp. bin170 TaxID=2695268 RepID=UPI0013E025CA